MIGTFFSSAPKSLLLSQNPRRNTCVASVQTAPRTLYTCNPTTSLYDVLKVNRNASTVEIKSAYRNLAKLYHPDSSPLDDSSDGRDFMEIHQAYSTLSDPSTRAIYDLHLTVGSMGRNSMNVGDYSGFNRTRRWETDQCW